MESLLREIRLAARSLLRDRGFAATVILTLAVCVAANTATFAIVHSVLLRPLPVPRAESIVLISNRYPKAGVINSTNSAAADYYDRVRDVKGLEDQALFRNTARALDVEGTPEQVDGMIVTPSFFRLVGVSPERGRAFTAEEGEQGNDLKVILSYPLWQRLYGGDASAVGRELRLNGRTFTIVGIMPRGFEFVDPDTRFWLPAAFSAEEKRAYHNNNWHHAGRLVSGVTIQQIQQQVDALNKRNIERQPELREVLLNAGFHSKAEPLQNMLIRDVEGALYLLWGGALCVLLIGGLNIANLCLARMTTRKKEFATRLALGAGRGQLLRQLSVESVVLALTGGAIGVALGAALLRLGSLIGLDKFPRAHEVHVDSVVVLFSLAMAVVVGLLIGVAPLTATWRASLSAALTESSRSGTSSGKTRRLRQALVAAEVACAFILLSGAGLLLASFRSLLNVDPGFQAQGVITASTNAPSVRYKDGAALRGLMSRSLEAIRRIPGVTGAGATTSIPFGNSHSDSVIIAEGHVMKSGESLISPSRLVITPGYFEAMKAVLVKGRRFDDRDNERSANVIIVDELVAKHFWPDRDPIGQRMFRPEGAEEAVHPTEKSKRYTVVGVVRTMKLEDLAEVSHTGAYYFPYEQNPDAGFTFALRTNGSGDAEMRAVRAEISKIDPALALFDIKRMTERAELSLSSRRTSMLLAMGFATVALFLSSIGIYGVLAYLVTQRRREIGIRLALGSTAGGIANMVLREGLALFGIGAVVGLLGTAAMQRVIAAQIHGVQPMDPRVMAISGALLGATALAACALPAWRAVKVNPASVFSE